jgi:molybdate transport system substrate-binding protein
VFDLRRLRSTGRRLHPASSLMSCLLLRIVLFGLAVAGGFSVHGAELAVAAASDLRYAFADLAREFEAAHPGTRINVTYGSSGNFYAQLRNRAPFDCYFSADIDYPRRLAAGGLALDGGVFLYAVGRLVVWAPVRTPVDVAGLGIRALLDPAARRIAIANPRHAPYGRAAMAALQSLGVLAEAEPRLVYGENVAQAAQFVQGGAADIGIIALALALRDAGRYWKVPLDAYPLMEQGGMITRWTREPDAARALRDFMLGVGGREVLQRYGFSLPGPPGEPGKSAAAAGTAAGGR